MTIMIMIIMVVITSLCFFGERKRAKTSLVGVFNKIIPLSSNFLLSTSLKGEITKRNKEICLKLPKQWPKCIHFSKWKHNFLALSMAPLTQTNFIIKLKFEFFFKQNICQPHSSVEKTIQYQHHFTMICKGDSEFFFAVTKLFAEGTNTKRLSKSLLILAILTLQTFSGHFFNKMRS